MMLSANKAGHIYHLACMFYFVAVDTMKRQAVNITYRSQCTSVGIITHETWLERLSSKPTNVAKCSLLTEISGKTYQSHLQRSRIIRKRAVLIYFTA
jgi:hypothetical protein